jgi:four helix bundle protein
MDNQEVTMHEPLIAHTTALKAAGIAIWLVSRVPTRFKSIADQVVRSARSVPANLAEGHGRLGKDRAYHWSVAYGSAKEAVQLFHQVRAMTWRLIHPKTVNK